VPKRGTGARGNKVVPANTAGTEVPNYLLPVINPPDSRTKRPKWDFLSQLTPQDRDFLNAAYAQEPDLVNRSAMIWVLGFVGDERTVNLLEHTLTLEFTGRQLSTIGEADPCEEPVMLYALEALGLLASHNETAFAFLKQGVDPQIWKSIAQWQSNLGADSYGILASRCIQALGMSGRPEVEKILLNLREADLVNRTDPHPTTARTLHGAVVDAAFYHYFIKNRGHEEFKMQVANRNLDQFREAWSQTDVGKEWKAWYRSERQKTR